jgi:hypothetical protein
MSGETARRKLIKTGHFSSFRWMTIAVENIAIAIMD